MKRKFFESISTKLLVINLVMLCIFGGILLVVHNSFSHVERSLTTIINQKVNPIILNGQLSRNLTTIFGDTRYLAGEYLENETLLTQHGATLIHSVDRLIADTAHQNLQEALKEYSQQLNNFLQKTLQITQLIARFHGLDGELTTKLSALDALVSEKHLFSTLEGSDSAVLEQINKSIPQYREMLLQLVITFGTIKQEAIVISGDTPDLSSPDIPQYYPTFFNLLGELRTRFKTLNIADQEITVYGQQLLADMDAYQRQMVDFHGRRIDFHQAAEHLKSAQERVLRIMNNLDKEIAQTTGTMRNEAAKIINDSERLILLFSSVFFIGLCVTWISMRWMTHPLVPLSNCAEQLADGDIEVSLQDLRVRDEVGALSNAFRKLLLYFQDMAHAVTEISKGNLDLEIAPRSRKDVLGQGFQQMILYLKAMGRFAADVTQGDLRSPITLRSTSDQLGHAFSHMRDGLIALIAEIRSGSDHIASISKHVLATATSNSEALSQIGNAAEVTSSAMREVSSSAEEVRLNTDQLSSSVEQTSASITQMISSIKHVAENSRKLSHFADDTRETMSNMVNSLATVATQTEHSRQLAETTNHDAQYGEEAVAQMSTRMRTISEVTQNISDIVARLESRSTEIGTILDVIEDVASKTTLLALNAAIIAAQAGVHGRGFAVVADEIKGLATQVEKSTKEIATIIQSVQQDSADAVEALDRGQQEVEYGVMVAGETGEALKKIGESARNSSEVAAQIAVVVREQTSASAKVAESVQDVTNMVSEISKATQEQENNSVQLFSVVETMQTLASQVARATQEQQQSTFHVTEFMEDVINLVEQNTPIVNKLAQTAHELADEAETLEKQVERFILPPSADSVL